MSEREPRDPHPPQGQGTKVPQTPREGPSSQSAGPLPGPHEGIERPTVLEGRTYKIKPGDSDHAMYVTVNDIVIDGVRYPFEVFINSRSMEHFQWVVALTRVISAVLRKGGNSTFLVEEMKSIFDPKGGYFRRGRYVPSVVAEIGEVLEKHLIGLGLITRPED